MCLRYAFSTTSFKTIKERFGVSNVPKLVPRYNIAPTQDVPVIFFDTPEEVSLARWGISGRITHFNARAETVDLKFRKDFEARRCLMLADAFYEWKDKRPYRFSLKDGGMFAFAGFYSIDNETKTCCMITSESNPLVAKIHDRMPVILPIGQEKEYLESLDDAKRLLKPYPERGMESVEISKEINSSKKDSAELIKPKTKKGTMLEWV